MMSMQHQRKFQEQPGSDCKGSCQSAPCRPQLRRRFSREDDGSNSEEVLSFLERQGSSVSELEIAAETIRDDDVASMEQILIHHHRAIHLTEISLPKNGLTAAAGPPLANIIQAQHETLTRLSLSCNPLTSAGLSALVDALSTESPPPSRLTDLDLSDTKLGGKGATVVASILRTNTSLRTLNLSKNDLGTRGMRALAPAIVSHGRLRHIDLSYNNLKPRGATLLAQALEAHNNTNDNDSRYDEELDERSGLRSIDLTCNRIGAQGIQALCDVLKFDRTIESLSCGKNELLPEGGAYVAYLLKSNYTLRSLDLQDNQIGPDAASLLVEQLTEDNQTLERIDLSYNSIGQQGAKDLADALMKNESLTVCLLDGNQIDSIGAVALANALSYNLTLTSLSLTHNQIDTYGAFAIANALGKPTCQIEIDCSENPLIGPRGLASLAHAPQLNRNRKFWLDELLKGVCKGRVSNIDMQCRRIADEEIILVSRALEERWSPTRSGSTSSFMSSSSLLSLASMADDQETPVRTMHVAGTDLTCRSLVPLIQATVPSSAKVLRLYLRDCKTEDPKFVETISHCLSLSTSLEVLSLVGCNLGEAGAVHLAEGLRTNMTLRRLNLDRNQIGDEGMKAIIHAVSNHSTLTSLSVGGNGITDACMEMSEGLMGLKEIKLDDNDVTDRGALDFCRFLMGNTGDDEMKKCKFEFISLRNNSLSKRGGETIKTFLGEKAIVNY